MKFPTFAILSTLALLSSTQFTFADDTASISANTDANDMLFTETQLNAMEGDSEKYEFQAEVNRLMDIVINSLYKNKEIFLRELISNASDALDKIRFKSIADKSALEGEPNMEVRISFDRESRTVTIADTGVGMTKVELIENLGTVAKSGTTNFMEQLGGEGNEDLSMIGQFGVGFYSIYLVSDRVTVASKSNDDENQHVWTSMADGSFAVGKDPRGNTLGRGTEITMYLKDDASEFLDDYKLESMVKKYSEFITFPIYLRKTVAETVLAEDEEEYEDGNEDEDDLEDLDDEGEEDDEDESQVSADKIKVGGVEVPLGEGGYDPDEDSVHDPSIKKEVFKFEWVRANDSVAIWAREKDEVSDDEYKEFYNNLSKDGTTSENWIHFKAEGEVEFKGIMYIPDEAPHDMWDRYYDKEAKIRLYVRKVLISDEFDDLVPQYLNFIRGVIDSDDLPLNVNRESLQQSKILKVMGKKIVRKALEMLRKMATTDAEFEADKDEKGDVKKAPYIRFWEQFGKSMKLGVIEDSSNRSKLIKLLRYKTSKTGEDDWRSLEDYVGDMKEWQQHIYYIAGADIDTVSKSAFCEKLHKKGLEILYLVDPIDEYAMQQITEFDGKRLMSVTKEGLKFGDEDEDLVAGREKAYNKKFQPLTRFLKQTYDKNVAKVVVSQRVEDSPVVIVTGQWGNSANMERIMRAQAFSDSNKNSYLNAQKTMEINPRHPLITKLLDMVLEDDRSQGAKDAAMMLYDTASLISGFQIEEIEDYNKRMLRVLKDNMGVESFDLEEEIEPEEDEEDLEDENEEDDGDAFDIDDLEGVGAEL
ncbi:hypothetical protein TrLO_g7074 [Triparma laevis f. longispina]|uniref:Histidine kinase/HSP90-like ATPase domain-containing protein n=1 Tax=Triparma laevis f. longispina TaxID=1714387 RepID=A0A9W7FQ73_9STRA|nr:hypothetical protein TrLO_g7074 [Triparma laevis f. longispina]